MHPKWRHDARLLTPAQLTVEMARGQVGPGRPGEVTDRPA
jgi:hypothetical protein